MKRPNRPFFSTILTAAAFCCSCGADDPSRVGRPPVVESYYPGDRSVTGFVGDTLSFQIDAFDPDDDPVATTFEVDGATVARTAHWNFAITETGRSLVRATVTDGEHSSYIEWQVTLEKPINLPPVVQAFQPVESNPVLVVGNRLDFALLAADPESQALVYTFTVNDSLVADERQFSYRAGSVGFKRVRAVVTDGEHFATREWMLKVTAVPDTIPPAEVTVTFYAPGPEPGEVELAWQAVGRDGMDGRPSEYQVRTAPVPILTEADWERASDWPGIPDPAQPGEEMRMTLTGLLPARETYLAVRAIDDFGNISPIATPVLVTTRGMRFGGRVLDALTGEGIPDVSLTFGLRVVRTDAGGNYLFEELYPVQSTLSVRDEDGPEVGDYFDSGRSYYVSHNDVVNFQLLPNYRLESTMYVDFLQFYRAMTDIAGNPYGPETRRWNLPINLYVRPFVNDGLDYKATIERVAGEFDAILGTKAFNIVQTRPGEGVETAYREGLAQDNYGVTEWTSDWYPRLALIEFRTVYTPATADVLEVTTRHELGHALGLGHSADTRHLMVGGPAPSADFFTLDETVLVRCLHGVARGWDSRLFQRN